MSKQHKEVTERPALEPSEPAEAFPACHHARLALKENGDYECFHCGKVVITIEERQMPTTTKPPKPPRLLKGYIANFSTLKLAASHDHLALVSAIRKADNKPVALVCAMNIEADDSIRPVPIAVMVEGNPYELFHDPTA